VRSECLRAYVVHWKSGTRNPLTGRQVTRVHELSSSATHCWALRHQALLAPHQAFGWGGALIGLLLLAIELVAWNLDSGREHHHRARVIELRWLVCSALNVSSVHLLFE
jgi:hypothetical protein